MSLLDSYIVNQEIKTVLKVYPDFIRLYQYAQPFYVRRFDFNERRFYDPDKPSKPSAIDPEEYERMSLGRAKTKVIDLALSNPFDMFMTFTFDSKKYDRYDVDARKQQLGFWFNNQRNIHGKFGYLVVPEYHKDGALHFHGLFMDYKGNLKDSGIKQNGRTVYNIASYRGGYTTAVKIDNIAKVAGYIGKYLTKDMPKFKGKQRYWRSNGLKLPLKIINPLLNNEDKELFSSIHKDNHVEIFEIRGQLPDNDLARIADYGKQRYNDLYATE